MSIETVVFPVAGLGTRMLPATRSVPKELLPVYDTPLIQFAIDEAIEAGARHLVFVSHPSKRALADYVNHALEERVAMSWRSDLRVTFVEQNERLGLGHAVLQARSAVGDRPFGVVLPDDLLLDGGALGEMAASFAALDCGALIGALTVPRAETSRYGIFAYTPSEGRVLPVDRIVEKPAPADAPSQLAAIGRYVLAPGIFEALAATAPGAGGEIQLTDAIDRMGRIFAFPVEARRFDCGSKEGLFAASETIRDARRADRAPMAPARTERPRLTVVS